MASANRGVAWERQIEVWNSRYRACNPSRAIVSRAEPPVKQIGSRGANGTFLAAYRERGPVDFLGFLPGGTGVAFDAKSTQGARWQFSLLERHQAQYLEAVAIAGHLAFIALDLGGRPFVVPWSKLGERWWNWQLNQAVLVRGDAGMSAADAAAWGSPMSSHGDWLSALRDR